VLASLLALEVKKQEQPLYNTYYDLKKEHAKRTLCVESDKK